LEIEQLKLGKKIYSSLIAVH